MARLTLLYPRWTGSYSIFGHFARRNSQWPPLNLSLLGAVAEQTGHETKIIDAEVEGFDAEQLAKKAVESKPDVIGLCAYSPFYHLSADVAAAIKKLNRDVPVILGGPHVTIVKEQAMQPQFDFLFQGEAERTLPLFLEEFSNGRDFSKIRGLIYRSKTGEIMNNGEPNWLSEVSMKKSDLGKNYPLDDLPLPARHLLPMRKYRLGTMQGRTHFSSIQSSRGCYWACIFCASDAIKTRRILMKSPRRVVEEMCDVVGKFPFITHFYIVDDVLLFWPEHILEIADRMDAAGLRVTFEGSTRANTVTEPIIKRLAKSGLVRLSFGLETIDPKMRETMGKKIPVEFYPKANRICQEYGVEPLNSLMIGLPGETPETIKATIEWVRAQRDISQANVAIAMPYPGTEFSEMALHGTHGVELLSKDFGQYLRYGSAVTRVNGMEPQELIDWQNWAFVRIYSAPWRWLPVIKKHGIFGFLMQMYRVLKLWKKRFLKWSPFQPVMKHPKES